MIYNQIVTWTAFAILAMFSSKGVKINYGVPQVYAMPKRKGCFLGGLAWELNWKEIRWKFSNRNSCRGSLIAQLRRGFLRLEKFLFRIHWDSCNAEHLSAVSIYFPFLYFCISEMPSELECSVKALQLNERKNEKNDWISRQQQARLSNTRIWTASKHNY